MSPENTSTRKRRSQQLFTFPMHFPAGFQFLFTHLWIRLCLLICSTVKSRPTYYYGVRLRNMAKTGIITVLVRPVDELFFLPSLYSGNAFLSTRKCS